MCQRAPDPEEEGGFLLHEGSRSACFLLLTCSFGHACWVKTRPSCFCVVLAAAGAKSVPAPRLFLVALFSARWFLSPTLDLAIGTLLYSNGFSGAALGVEEAVDDGMCCGGSRPPSGPNRCVPLRPNIRLEISCSC